VGVYRRWASWYLRVRECLTSSALTDELCVLALLTRQLEVCIISFAKYQTDSLLAYAACADLTNG
jgi:hypothetical protein